MSGKFVNAQDSSYSDGFTGGGGGGATCSTGPSIYTNAATNVTLNSATLNGGITIDEYCYINLRSFSWGSGSSYSGIGSWDDYTTIGPAGRYGASYSFSTNISGLSCGTTYSFRASGSGGTSSGTASTVSFTTLGCNPNITTLSATSVGVSTATLNGSIYSGSRTINTVSFTYGASTTNSVSDSVSFGGGTTNTFSHVVTGLACNTTYNYSAFGRDTGGGNWAASSGATFTTSACPTPPSVTSVTATSVGMYSATLQGNITSIGTGGNATTRGFNYGATTSYGSTSIETGSFATGSFNYTLSGLACGTVYNYNAYAINSGGINSPASNISFTTSACPTPPVVVSATATSVTTNSAVLKGNITSIGTGGAPISRGFNYGATTSYGITSVETGTFGTGVFSYSLHGLSCGQTYHYNAYAINSAGINSPAADISFTTLQCTGGSMGTLGGNIHGYVGSYGLGWMSLNCAEGSVGYTSVCGASNYSVNVVPDPIAKIGNFFGYAWNPFVGWISFQAPDVTACGVGISGSLNPGETVQVDLNATSSTYGVLTGWARVISARTTDGWDGCISFKGGSGGTAYGVTYNAASSTNNLTGYAWGDDILGWVRFTNATLSLPTPAVVFTANSISATSSSPTITLTSDGGPVSLGWATANLSTNDCTASGEWSGSLSSSGGSQIVDVPENTGTSTVTHTYTLSGCTSVTGGVISSQSVTVAVPALNATVVKLLANEIPTSSTAPLVVTPKSPVTLTWQVQNVNANTCRGTSSGSFTNWVNTTKLPSDTATSTPATFSEVVGADGSITTSRNYTMTCTSSISGGSVSSTVYVAMDANPSVVLAVNGVEGGSSVPTIAPLASTGGSITLSWVPLNVASCSADGDWSGSKSASSTVNTQSISLPASTSTATSTYFYKITCYTSDGVPTDSSTVTVQVRKTATTTISLQANGVTTTSSDSNSSPTYTFTDVGGSLTLSWSTANVTACTASGGTSGDGWYGTSPSSLGGSVTIMLPSNGTGSNIYKTYGISCTPSGGGSITAPTAYIAILNPSAPTVLLHVGGEPAPTIANAVPVLYGQSSNLSWYVQNINGDSCYGTSVRYGSHDGTFSGGTTANVIDGWTGTSDVKLPHLTIGGTGTYFSENIGEDGSVTTDRSYTITCTSTTGSTVSSTAYVAIDYANVIDWPTSTDPVLNLYVDGTQITTSDSYRTLSDQGGEVVLSWVAANLSSCTASGDWSGTLDASNGAHAQTMNIPPNTTSASVNLTYAIDCVTTSGAPITSTADAHIRVAGVGDPVLTFTGNGHTTNQDSPLNITSGGSVELAWTTQNILVNSCTGTSSGSYSNWSGGTKYPIAGSTGSTPLTYAEMIGVDGSITGDRTYTLHCTSTSGTGSVSMTRNVYIHAEPLIDRILGCPGGLLCSTTRRGFLHLPWLEI